MKLFLISQDQNTGYDTYDSAVVVAEDEDSARRIYPSGQGEDVKDWGLRFSSWCNSPERVDVQYLGEAAGDWTPTVICASFNAG